MVKAYRYQLKGRRARRVPCAFGTMNDEILLIASCMKESGLKSLKKQFKWWIERKDFKQLWIIDTVQNEVLAGTI